MGGFVVVLSGGLDSAVLLWHLQKLGTAARAVTIDYGQRHRTEVLHAEFLAEQAGIAHEVVDLSPLRRVLPGSSQTDDRVAVPEGHYEDASMRATVVPNRNMLLLAVAMGIAVAHDLTGVAYGAHSGDHAIYPDCRPEFVQAMKHAFALCDYTPRKLIAPFAKMSKAQIVRLGHALDVPFADTWTCYAGGEKHCGRCGACVERREAFVQARVADPTEYEAS